MLILSLKAFTRLAVLVCLALTFSFTLQRAEAQAPDGYTIYLPLVVKGGQSETPPSGPYTQMLAKVQQMCAATGFNQVCIANGQGTVQPIVGPVAVNQPGTITDLANVQSLSLASSGTDPEQWSLAWLRLRADSNIPDQELTILAFGNVQISPIALFTGQTNPDDTVTLPSLQFVSSPVAGVTKLGSSGLIVTNPTDNDLLSLNLNGATITLGSTALVEAQPSDKMTVTMATGTSLTEVNGEGSLALQNQRVSVPLNQNGLASGSPTAATSLENDEFISQMLDDLYQRLLEDKQLANAALTRLNQALDRCIGGRAAYVYNVLYWIRIIENSPGFKSLIDSAKLVQTYDRVPNCLSFEIDFDSTVITTHPDLYKSSHLTSEGLSLEFLADGTFIALNNSLNYLSHVFNPSQYCGTITTQKMPGELQMDGGSLKIAGNKVRVSMLLRVSKQPTDSATLSCPPAPPLVLGQQHWVSVFYHVHEDLWQKPDPVFRFTDWKYNGGENFAEAIYVRTLTESEFTFDTTTFLVLVHTPQK